MQKISAIFPGQGSHFVGMYKGLYDASSIVRETIGEAEKVTGIKLSEICFKGPLSVLTRPENAHIAIVSFGVAAFRFFISETGIVPQFCAGHSLGEYTALVSSGAMKFSDALKLVQLRYKISKNVRKKYHAGMTILDGVEREKIEDICKSQQIKGKKVYISCYNSDTQIAISGVDEDLQDTEEIIRTKGCTITPLLNSPPFHCQIMNEGVNQLKEAISQIEFKECRYPIMSNYTAKPYINKFDYIDNLSKHLTNPVRWAEIINYFQRKGINLVIDFSANNIFENIIGAKEDLKVTCFGVKGEREALFKLLSQEKDMKNRFTFISKCILTAISTPNFNISDKCNNEIATNYNKLLDINLKVKDRSVTYSTELEKEVLTLLKYILKDKGINSSKQREYIDEILDENGLTYRNLI